MKVLKSNDLIKFLNDLELFKLYCSGVVHGTLEGLQVKKTPKRTPPPPSVDFIKKLMTCLLEGERVCRHVGLKAANAKLSMTNAHLKKYKGRASFSSLEADLRNAQDMVFNDLQYRKFVEIDPKVQAFLNNEKLFGNDVFEAFPSAVDDVLQAGNCLAVGCSTAAVFHLMRVGEHGLRALAHDRRIAMPKKTPIELATWDQIIKGLEQVEEDIQQFPKTLAREQQFLFYHEAMMEFKRFKNTFRNRVMHTREDYNSGEAFNLFHHVKNFMEILASRITEGKRTPRVWKRIS